MASSFEIKSTRPSVGETIVTIVRDHIDYRKQIFKLAGSDLRRTYRASALGWSWAIIKPLVTIFVYWFAFAIGLRRGGDIAFEKVPVDASSKMPDDHMDSIEPYNYKDLKPFSTAYLPGFLADKYDVSVADSQERADSRCTASLEAALRRTANMYDTCVPLNQDIRLKRGKVHYALLPVWMLHTKWNGKDFLFAMNGQTGRLVGDLPTDMGKFWTTFAAIAIPVTALATLILHIL